MWVSIQGDPTKIFSGVNSLIFLVGAFFTLVQLNLARQSRNNTAFSHIYAQLSELNKETLKSPYMRTTVEHFSRLSIPPSDNLQHNEDTYQLYCSTRTFHLELVNLLAQVWLLSGCPRRLKGKYRDWENLAGAVMGDLTGERSACKPIWYRNACMDLWSAIKQDKAYPQGFASWLKRIPLPPEGPIY
jgi:hypothetical protein